MVNGADDDVDSDRGERNADDQEDSMWLFMPLVCANKSDKKLQIVIDILNLRIGKLWSWREGQVADEWLCSGCFFSKALY